MFGQDNKANIIVGVAFIMGCTCKKRATSNMERLIQGEMKRGSNIITILMP